MMARRRSYSYDDPNRKGPGTQSGRTPMPGAGEPLAPGSPERVPNVPQGGMDPGQTQPWDAQKNSGRPDSWFLTTPADQANVYGGSQAAFQNIAGGLYDESERYKGRVEGDRIRQADAAQAYRQAMLGNAPSIAQLQLRSGMDQNVSNAIALAGAGRGGSLAASQRQAGMASGAAGQQLAQQTAMLRAQEIDAARGGYANIANTMAEQSIRGRLGVGQMQHAALAQNQSQLTAQTAINEEAKARREALAAGVRQSDRAFGLQVANQTLKGGAAIAKIGGYGRNNDDDDWGGY